MAKAKKDTFSFTDDIGFSNKGKDMGRSDKRTIIREIKAQIEALADDHFFVSEILQVKIIPKG